MMKNGQSTKENESNQTLTDKSGGYEDSNSSGPLKPELSAEFPGLIEIVEGTDGKTAFLIKQNGTPKVVSQYEHRGRLLVPPSESQIPFHLPRAEEVLKISEESKDMTNQEIDETLFNDLREYHRGISELPSDAHYNLLSAWDMHTYLLEQFRYSPYLLFHAVTERGKSRTGNGIMAVSRRGFTTETVNTAVIQRLSQYYTATLFF